MNEELLELLATEFAVRLNDQLNDQNISLTDNEIEQITGAFEKVFEDRIAFSESNS